MYNIKCCKFMLVYYFSLCRIGGVLKEILSGEKNSERGLCMRVQRMEEMVEEVKWMRNWLSDCCGGRNPGDSWRGVTGVTQAATMRSSKVDESLFDSQLFFLHSKHGTQPFTGKHS